MSLFEAEHRRIVREELEDAFRAFAPPTPLPRPTHVDYDGAAHLMSISVKSVKKLIAEGVLPTVDAPLDRVLIPVAAIENLPTTTRRALRRVS